MLLLLLLTPKRNINKTIKRDGAITCSPAQSTFSARSETKKETGREERSKKSSIQKNSQNRFLQIERYRSSPDDAKSFFGRRRRRYMCRITESRQVESRPDGKERKKERKKEKRRTTGGIEKSASPLSLRWF